MLEKKLKKLIAKNDDQSMELLLQSLCKLSENTSFPQFLTEKEKYSIQVYQMKNDSTLNNF